MKRNMKSLVIAVSMLSVLGFTSCDENATMNIDGPKIDITFAYSDLRSTNTADWVEIATDTVFGENIDAYLSKDSANAAKADAVKSATIMDGELIVTGGNFNFDGVDSVKISYRIVNSTQVINLVVGAPKGTSKDTIFFSDIKFEKELALDLIGKDKVVGMYAKFNPLLVNCFQPGAIYNFKANTRLAVLTSAAGDLISGF